MKPPAEISHEELLKLETDSPAYCAAHSMRVGSKKITFIDRTKTTEIAFQRGINGGGSPDFQIECKETQPITEKCSMGHRHETGKRELKYGRIQLTWEQAEMLMEWFQSGDWKTMRAARIKEKAYGQRKETLLGGDAG